MSHELRAEFKSAQYMIAFWQTEYNGVWGDDNQALYSEIADMLLQLRNQQGDIRRAALTALAQLESEIDEFEAVYGPTERTEGILRRVDLARNRVAAWEEAIESLRLCTTQWNVPDGGCDRLTQDLADSLWGLGIIDPIFDA